MVMSDHITQREKDKFVEDSSGNTSIRVLSTWSKNEYKVNEIETSGNITYFGKENYDGDWLIFKIDTSSGTVFSYATKKNNASITTYSDAWTNRTTLTYGDYSDAM